MEAATLCILREQLFSDFPSNASLVCLLKTRGDNHNTPNLMYIARLGRRSPKLHALAARIHLQSQSL